MEDFSWSALMDPSLFLLLVVVTSVFCFLAETTIVTRSIVMTKLRFLNKILFILFKPTCAF